MVEFVEPDVFKKKAGEPKRVSRNNREKRSIRGLPKSLVDLLPMTRWQEPVYPDNEESTLVYRRVCPIEDCEYLSGRYVSHESAARALRGHLRWVHNYG